MRPGKAILTFALTMAMALGLCVTPIAAQAEGYTYTVTFYAGNQGSFQEQAEVTLDSEGALVTETEEKIVVSGLKAGDKVGLNAQSAVTLESGSKYYVQGIRMSGRDNATVSASMFEVEGDADYVVAYGIKGNQVKYTVKYQDENGKDLMASENFYGNVGDKPVVAYRYVDGYAPKALGLTKTLSANEAENVFLFVYTGMPSVTVNETVQEETVTVVTPGVAGGNAAAGTGGAAGNGAGGDETGTAGETAGAVEETEGAEEAEESGTDMIVDLDEEEVPLAEGEATEAEETDSSMAPYLAMIGAGVAALIVLGVLFVYLKKKK